jgi:hypothetical protein
MHTTGLPFWCAYADEAVRADILLVQSALISDCMLVQPLTSYMMKNLRLCVSAEDRTFAAIASRVGPSELLGLKRCNAAVSQPFCCIHRKCVSTVCWS